MNTDLTMKEKREKEQENFFKSIGTLEKMPTANIIVTGLTGVGKSTLINAVFGKKLAETGRGRPITQDIKMYESEDQPIRIWDSAGFELDADRTEKTIQGLKDIIADKSKSPNQFDRIHAIWYCTQATGDRFQKFEANFVRRLYENHVPFIIVMTKCFSDDDDIEFEETIHNILNENGLGSIAIVRTLAEEKKVGGFVVPPSGLDKLIDLTLEKMPEFLKSSFVAAQRIDKSKKRELSVKEIEKYVRAAKEGFWDKVPIANIISTNNKLNKMFEHIAQLYNTNLTPDKIEEVIKFSTSEWKGAIATLLEPFKGGWPNELKTLVKKLELETDMNMNESNYSPAEKSAWFIAVMGLRFMYAIEAVWDELTESQLKDLEMVVERLKTKLKKSYGSKR